MGEKRIRNGGLDADRRRTFLGNLLQDVQALDLMIREGRFEQGVRRIGAEQELFLVDASRRPAPRAMEVLAAVADPHFTNELGLFNLEINLDPCDFGHGCLRKLEEDLDRLFARLDDATTGLGLDVVLTGILPTLRQSDLGLDSMTPLPRYRALNRAMNELRGSAYELHIRGLDELRLKHESVMLEACNASFQVHFQVSPARFANLYNVSQVAAAPVLAAATNSPLLFGRQLWRETRIALFQQSVDTRARGHDLREAIPRVTFGKDWIRGSVVDLYKEDIARFRALLAPEVEENSMDVARAGGVPELHALRAHNSTVYRWNRACYGVLDGKPHLRIENRILPAGPTVTDEVANAAFWFGLISGLAARHPDITEVMEFRHAKMNFTSAARQGLAAEMTWLEGNTLPAARLICDHLLPLAEEGLRACDCSAADVSRYLAVIHDRVSQNRTGSQWLVHSLNGMKEHGPMSHRLRALTAAAIRRRREGRPVHEWTLATLEEGGHWRGNFLRVEEYMTTDLFTVREEDSLELVASLMEWERIRHVPVEDGEHRLIGLISYRTLLRLLAQGGTPAKTAASEVMKRDPITVSPETSTFDAIDRMRANRIGCLPVVRDGRLIGIITERDFMRVSAELLQEVLRG